ncbi:carboxylating nicotinate-nucleotide diphosphorylase [bacterium]|nr:carboxylating nicotinate-nucleotide diphosphorylase [bacterium]
MNIEDFNHPLPLRERIRLALREDLSDRGDVTTDAVFDEGVQGRAVVVAKANGVLCGVAVFAAVFAELGGVTVTILKNDGAAVVSGDRVLELSGRVRSLLAGERTALNLLQQLSGVATLTAQLVAATSGRIAVCDTRKTVPLWRDLQKYAVKCGGGTNHRMGLHDMVMLKDTHADGAGSVREALRRVSPLKPELRVAAEARDLGEVQQALDGGADLIMLDNMDRATMEEAVRLIAGRAQTEITGGITEESAGALADLGVDRISVGAVTHSARALDLSMRLTLD